MSDGSLRLTCGQCKYRDEKDRCYLYGDSPVTPWRNACMSFEPAVPDNRIPFMSEAMREYDEAVKKHPVFASSPTMTGAGFINALLHSYRRTNDDLGSDSTAYSILKEEVLEAFSAWLKGDKANARKEFAQCVAVIMRCVEMMEATE